MEPKKELKELSKAIQAPGCPNCNHPPIAHVQGICIVCMWEVGQAIRRKGNECRHVFDFKLTPAEREQAMKADKMAFEQDDLCAQCGLEWMQHSGYLCPSGDSTFVLLFKGTGAHKIV